MTLKGRFQPFRMTPSNSPTPSYLQNFSLSSAFSSSVKVQYKVAPHVRRRLLSLRLVHGSEDLLFREKWRDKGHNKRKVCAPTNGYLPPHRGQDSNSLLGQFAKATGPRYHDIKRGKFGFSCGESSPRGLETRSLGPSWPTCQLATRPPRRVWSCYPL